MDIIGEKGGGMNWETGLTYTVMYKIDNLDGPLCSIGSSTQCSVVT